MSAPKKTEYPAHRGGECSSCDGTGIDIYEICEHEDHDDHADDGDICPECPECPECDGAADSDWVWEPGDVGDCFLCPALDVEVMPAGEDVEEPACLDCVTRWHARGCGCGLWPKAAP